MEDDSETSKFRAGFAVGFITSVALCMVYWGVIVAERKPPTPTVPVDVYKFTPSGPVGRGDPATSLILKYGAPDRGPATLSYLNHVVGYDQTRRIPQWVAEHVTKEHITGDADRDKCSFKPDKENVDEMFSSTLDDFYESGYDRGHMSPAANHRYSQDAMCDSFYLTNVVPQDSLHNRNYWADVEHYCRELAERYEEVRVITGPLFLPEVAEGATQEKRFVTYEVIGESNVTVPTHLFKIIMVENSTEASSTTLFSTAFLFPNKPINSEVPLISFQVPLAQLEAAAGLQFFPRLAGAPVGDLCSIEPCQQRGEVTRATYSFTGFFLSSPVLTIISLVWVFLVYKWRAQGGNAQKK